MGDAEVKDFWDKVSAAGPLLVGLTVSGIGTWFTVDYNQRQISLQELQTVESFFPHLLGDQESKELAILTISTLGNTRMATELAVRYASAGTEAALQSLSASADLEAKAMADSALRTLEGRRLQLVRDMFADDRQTRIAATTELVRKWTSDSRVLALVLEEAGGNLDNPSGRINTLVLLENVDAELLVEYGAEVDALLQALEGVGGDQTGQHAQAVRARLDQAARP